MTYAAQFYCVLMVQYNVTILSNLSWVGLGPFPVGLGWVGSKNMDPCPFLSTSVPRPSGLQRLCGNHCLATVAQHGCLAKGVSRMLSAQLSRFPLQRSGNRQAVTGACFVDGIRYTIQFFTYTLRTVKDYRDKSRRPGRPSVSTNDQFQGDIF